MKSCYDYLDKIMEDFKSGKYLKEDNTMGSFEGNTPITLYTLL